MAENRHSMLRIRRAAKSTKVVPFEIEDDKSDQVVFPPYEETSLYKALRTLQLPLSLGGLIFKKEFSRTGIKRHLTISHVYSFTVLIFLSCNVLRLLTMFHSNEKFNTLLVMKAVLLVYSIQNLAHFVAFFIASESYERLPKFFLEWEKFQTNCSQSLTSISRLSNICAAGVWSIIVCNSGACTYLIFFTDLQNMQLAPWDDTFEYAFVIRIINTIQQVYLTIIWVASSALMFIICRTLAHEFNKVSFNIKKLSHADPTKLARDFEIIRQNHQKLCGLIADADDIFSMQVACSLSGSLILSCLNIYIILYNDSNSIEILLLTVQLFWIVTPVGKVVMDCVSGTILNEAVRCRRSGYRTEESVC